MLRILLSIIVVIAASVGIVALLGARLPVGHVASRSAVINAPVDAVFHAMTDFSAAPSWRPRVNRVAVTRDSLTGHQRIVEESKTGVLPMEVEQFVPPTRFVTRIVDKELPYGGVWAYALEPQGEATRVTITEHGEVYNPIFRFIAKYIMGHAGTIDTYLSDLGRKFNTPVTIVDAEPVPAK